MRNIKVVVTKGPHTGNVISPEGSQVFLGRDTGCGVALSRDKGISGRHAVLEWQDSAWYLRDIHSKNGTWVEVAGKWERITTPKQVHTSEKYAIGSTVFCVEIIGEKAPCSWWAPTVMADDDSTLKKPAQQELLRVDINGDTLKYQFLTPGAYGTQYTIRWCEDDANHINSKLDALVRTANHERSENRRNGEDQVSRELESIGTFLRKHILPRRILDKLDTTPAQELFISHPASLVHMPWELIFTEGKPLCLRFSMGRQVILENYSSRIAPHSDRPVRMLIVANPTSDLEAAQQEAEILFHSIRAENPHLSIEFLAGPRIERVDLLTRLEHSDIVYYIGHAEYDPDNPPNSGWLLRKGRITAADFRRIEHPPGFVFANGCETGKEAQWSLEYTSHHGVYGIASSFILAGVTNFIGAMWPIATEGSMYLAREFFHYLVRGVPVGESLRRARLDLLQQFGRAEIVWASYVLFGDPGNRVFDARKV